MSAEQVPVGVCPFPAGSPAKIAVLRERLERRLPLFHPDDSLAIVDPPRSCPADEDPLLAQMLADAPIALPDRLRLFSPGSAVRATAKSFPFRAA